MADPLFVLTSDLGTDSPAVAQLKAVLLSASPHAQVVDLSHSIAPQSIREAELALRVTAYMFRPGTVHVVVVDPDVGTDRRALAVFANGRYFVGPDNGVLGVALRQPGAQVVSLDRDELWRKPVANTFHGRDIFAPVAAALAAGAELSSVGTSIDDPKPSGIPEPVQKNENTLMGETLGRDRFGNLHTNIPAEWAGQAVGEGWNFEVGGKIIPYRSTYMAAKIGRMIVTVGADRFIEIAVAQGSAAEVLGASEGIEVFCASRRPFEIDQA